MMPDGVGDEPAEPGPRESRADAYDPFDNRLFHPALEWKRNDLEAQAGHDQLDVHGKAQFVRVP